MDNFAECVIIPEELEAVEHVLLSSCSCYHQALMLKPSDALRCRIGNVHNELSVIYMNKITSRPTCCHFYFIG